MNFIFSPDETLVDTCINVKELRIHNYTTLLTLCTRQGEYLFLRIVLKQNIIHVCKHSSIQCPHIFANTLSEVCWANWVIDSIYAC